MSGRPRSASGKTTSTASVFDRPFSSIELQPLVEVSGRRIVSGRTRKGINLENIYREIKSQEREARERRAEKKVRDDVNHNMKKRAVQAERWIRPAIVSGVGRGSITGKGTLDEIMSTSLQMSATGGRMLRSNKGASKKLSDDTRVSAPSKGIRAVQLAKSLSAARFNENVDSHFGRSIPNRTQSVAELKKLSSTIRKLVSSNDSSLTSSSNNKTHRVSSFNKLSRQTSSAIERARAGSKNSKMLRKMHAIETSADTRDQHLASILSEPTPKVVTDGSIDEAASEMMRMGLDHPLHLEWEADPSFKFDPYSNTAKSTEEAETQAPDSPRLAYSKLQSTQLHNAVKVMMEFTDEQMEEIRSILNAENSAELNLSQSDLVKFAMLVGGRDATVENKHEVAAWCDMFCDTDYNSSRFQSYSEFTSYLVELANARHAVHHLDKLMFTQYETNGKPMINNHGLDFAYCKYFEPLNCFLAFEENCPRMKVYDVAFNLAQTKRGHVGSVLDAAYLPDHRMMVTCEFGTTAGNNLRFWSAHQHFSDPDFLSHLTTWKLPAASHKICWTGSALCTADSIGNILLWNLAAGETKHVLDKHTDIVHDMLPIPSSHYFVSGSADCTVRLWDDFSGRSNMCFSGHTKSVKALSWSSDYGILASGGEDDFAILWSPLEKRAIRKLRFRQEGRRKRHGVRVDFGSVVSMSVHQNELILADEQRVVRVFDLRTFKELQRFSLPLVSVKDGMLLDEKGDRNKAAMGLGMTQIALSSDIVRPAGSARLSKMTSYHASREKKDHKEGKSVTQDQLLTEHQLVFSCGPFLYNYKKQAHVRLDHADDNSIGHALFNPRALSFLTEAAGNIKIWDAMTGRLSGSFGNCRAALKNPDALVSACELDHSGSSFYLGYENGDVHVFDYRTGTLSHSLEAPKMTPSEILHIQSIEVEDKSGYGENLDKVLRVITVRKNCVTSYAMNDDKLDSAKSVLPVVHCAPLHHHVTSCCAITPTLASIALGSIGGVIKVLPADLSGEAEHIVHPTHLCDKWRSNPPISPSEVTALSFLQQYPVLIAAYNGGYIEGYYLLPRKRVVRLFRVLNTFTDSKGQPSGSSISSTVTSLKIDQREGFSAVVKAARKYSYSTALCEERPSPREECLLYTVDDNGCIKTWDICKLIEGCKIAIAQAKKKAILLHGWSESEVKDAHYPRVLECVTEQSVLTAFKDCSFAPSLTLRPHDGAVRGIDIIYNSRDVQDKSIMSHGEDGRVYLHHTRSGEKLGDLRQVYINVNPPAPTEDHWKLHIDFMPRKHARDGFIEGAVKQVLKSDIAHRWRNMQKAELTKPTVDLSAYKAKTAQQAQSDINKSAPTEIYSTGAKAVTANEISKDPSTGDKDVAPYDSERLGKELERIESIVSRRPIEQRLSVIDANLSEFEDQQAELSGKVYHELTAPVLEKEYSEAPKFGITEEEERKQALQRMAREIQARDLNPSYDRRSNQTHSWESILDHAPPDVMSAYILEKTTRESKRHTREQPVKPTPSVIPGVANMFRSRWNVKSRRRPASAYPLARSSGRLQSQPEISVDDNSNIIIPSRHGLLQRERTSSTDKLVRPKSSVSRGSRRFRSGSHIGLERAMDDVSFNQKQRFLNIYPAFRVHRPVDPNLRSAKDRDPGGNSVSKQTHRRRHTLSTPHIRKPKRKSAKDVHTHRFGYTSHSGITQ